MTARRVLFVGGTGDPQWRMVTEDQLGHIPSSYAVQAFVSPSDVIDAGAFVLAREREIYDLALFCLSSGALHQVYRRDFSSPNPALVEKYIAESRR